MKVNGPSIDADKARTKPEASVPAHAVRLDIEPVMSGR